MEKLTKVMQKQFDKMCQTGMLFRSEVSGDSIWSKYLSSFKPENNGVFRDPNSNEHNCNLCKNFIRRYGNIVSIDSNGKLETIFTNLGNVDEYNESVIACDRLVKSFKISNVFFETFDELKSLPYERCTKNQSSFKLGIAENYKQYTKEEADKYGGVVAGRVYTFNHFNLTLPSMFVDSTGKSIGSIEGFYRDKYSVFKRVMEEISIDTLILVRDLINQGSLLDGNTHLPVLLKIIEYKEKQQSVNSDVLDNWYWSTTYNMADSVAKFRNHLIGTLCVELSEGKELNNACQDFNKRVDPKNYHKAKAPITQAQINLAKKFVEDNGYAESFNRRLATIDDIKASEILHINRDNGKSKAVNIFDNIKTPSGVGRHKRSEFDKVEEVGIDKFMSEILPNCTSLELLFENRMEGNLVNLTTSAENSKPIFKWNNPFSYTFNGNLAGKSMIKENVKSAGGNVDGVLRFSIQWNDDDTKGIVDFDAHAVEPNGTEIAFNTYKGHKTKLSGMLDVDMINPSDIGVENITWINENKMIDGSYRFFVRNFNGRNNTGFKAEIAYKGEVYNYHYSGNAERDINVATVVIKNGVATITHHLPEISTNKSLWNLNTNEFHKVSLMSVTPNHWGSDAVGNKYYLFMLNDCKNPNQVRGFHNEHLISDLLQHRKVLDILGSTALIEPTENQIAGVGFNATVRDEIIVRVSGSFKRVIKIKF